MFYDGRLMARTELASFPDPRALMPAAHMRVPRTRTARARAAHFTEHGRQHAIKNGDGTRTCVFHSTWHGHP